jgi:hypothetical protein
MLEYEHNYRQFYMIMILRTEHIMRGPVDIGCEKLKHSQMRTLRFSL